MNANRGSFDEHLNFAREEIRDLRENVLYTTQNF